MTKKPKIEGPEVAAQAKQARLDQERKASAEMAGKASRFTPNHLDHLQKLEDLEKGQVIGVLDTELAGDETDLPPGKYNVFVRKGDAGEWEAVAETGGRIVSKAARVKVVTHKERPKGGKHPGDVLLPEFREHGWCWWVCFPLWGFWVCVLVCW